jgi:hypothetical protein
MGAASMDIALVFRVVYQGHAVLMLFPPFFSLARTFFAVFSFSSFLPSSFFSKTQNSRIFAASPGESALPVKPK